MKIDNNLLYLAPLTKAFREHLLEDSDRPKYHFCVPEGNGQPGDPNGCFYANGRYHMMYLYHHEELGFCWGHVSSIDLLHWRHHPDCLVTGPNSKGCFSGGAFLDDDGRCYISFWDFVADKHDFGGIRIAVSECEPYEEWTIMPEYAVCCNVDMGVGSTKDKDGKEVIIGVADPSNIWKHDGRYYMQTGNLLVLDKYSRGENPPEHLRGDWSELFSSDDMQNWVYEGRFYNRSQCPGTDDSEDCMCPSFLPLPSRRDGKGTSDKYLQLFISHNRGCQYYIGTYDGKNNKFTPETRGRMTVIDSAYFAPEALIGPDGRQIMWSWLRDDPDDTAKRGWSGVFGMARELWYDESDGTLCLAPAIEYERLRINAEKVTVDLKSGEKQFIKPVNSLSLEMNICDIDASMRDSFELRLRESEGEFVSVYYDSSTNELVMDTTNGTARGWAAVERMPVNLKDDEKLTLRVFVDMSVIEIYANSSAAICRRVYPEQNGSGISVTAKGSSFKATVNLWEMAPCNPF